MRPTVSRLVSVGLSLAAWFIAAPVWAAIGPLDSFRIANTGSGLCWNLPDGDIKAGSPLEQYPCRDVSTQSFHFQGTRLYRTPGDPGLIRSAGNPAFCVAAATNGDGLVLQPCDVVGETKAQLWLVNAFDLRQSNLVTSIRLTGTNACIDVPDASQARHRKLRLFDCDGRAAQQWLLLPSSEMR